MNSYPFTLSLKPNIQVIPSDDSYTLKPTEKNSLLPTDILTLTNSSGVDNALELLQQGDMIDALLKTITEKDGIDASEAFSATLQQIGDRGWLQYSVLPFPHLKIRKLLMLGLMLQPNLQMKPLFLLSYREH